MVTSDDLNIIVPAADKTNRDCILVFNAKTGGAVHKISLKSCGIKVLLHINLLKLFIAVVLGSSIFNSDAS